MELRSLAAAVNIKACRLFNFSQYAARAGYLSCLRWLQDTFPACTESPHACVSAAAAGSLAMLQWLRNQERPWQWNNLTCFHAARGGHLEVLKWLHSQQPPCPSPRSCYGLGAAGGAIGHLDVVEWLVVSDLVDIGSLAEHAANAGSFEIFEILARHQCLDKLPMLSSVFDAAGQGSLDIAQVLTPYLHNHASSNAVFQALLAAMRRASGFLVTHPGVLEVIKWFYGQFTSFTPLEEQLLRDTVTYRRSSVLVELAASSCGPLLAWTPEAHTTAAGYGDLTLLRWLLHESKYDGPKKVDTFWCPGRTLLLVHGHGWTLSDALRHQKYGLSYAEQQYLAFYGAARRHRLQPCSEATASLGSLPDILLKKIACMAHIDFSWTFCS